MGEASENGRLTRVKAAWQGCRRACAAKVAAARLSSCTQSLGSAPWILGPFQSSGRHPDAHYPNVARTLVRPQLVQRLKVGGEVGAAHGSPHVARAAAGHRATSIESQQVLVQ